MSAGARRRRGRGRSVRGPRSACSPASSSRRRRGLRGLPVGARARRPSRPSSSRRPRGRTGSSSRREGPPESARARPLLRSCADSDQRWWRGGGRRRTPFRRVSRLTRSRCGDISRRQSVPDGSEWASLRSWDLHGKTESDMINNALV